MSIHGALGDATSTTAGALGVALLLLLGLTSGLRGALRAARGAYVYFLRPGKPLKRLGKWAVVTGATDGIGKAYATALARKGFNVLLLSRTQAKLDEVAAELKAKAGVEAQTLAVDFGKADAAAWARIGAAVAPLEVGVLVNNVGLSYDHAEYYDQIEPQLIDDLITVNIQATNKMTRAVLPGMLERRRGAIVNIGSAAATVAPSGPLYAVYAGTKLACAAYLPAGCDYTWLDTRVAKWQAYVDMFSKSLDLEYRPRGLTVHNQAPAYVATKMSKIRKPTLDAPTPAAWAAAALKHIGYEPTQTPYWYHGLMWGVVSSVPEAWINGYLLSFHKVLRDKYYKKRAREAKAQ